MDDRYDDLVPAIARRYRDYFTTIVRPQDDRTIWVIKREHRGDNGEFTPAKSLVYAAHDDGGMLTEDWRMEWIVASLDQIIEADEDDDLGELYKNFYGDHMLSELCDWLLSHASRIGYVDSTKGDPYYMDWGQHDLSSIIRFGQEQEYEEVYGIVLEHLRKVAEEEYLNAEYEEEEEED